MLGLFLPYATYMTVETESMTTNFTMEIADITVYYSAVNTPSKVVISFNVTNPSSHLATHVSHMQVNMVALNDVDLGASFRKIHGGVVVNPETTKMRLVTYNIFDLNTTKSVLKTLDTSDSANSVWTIFLKYWIDTGFRGLHGKFLVSPVHVGANIVMEDN